MRELVLKVTGSNSPDVYEPFGLRTIRNSGVPDTASGSDCWAGNRRLIWKPGCTFQTADVQAAIPAGTSEQAENGSGWV